MKVGMYLGKVEKFGIDWYFPSRMAADNALLHALSPPQFLDFGTACFPLVFVANFVRVPKSL